MTLAFAARLTALLMALVASPSGWLSDRYGTRGFATAGLVILALGLGGLSTIGQGTPLATPVRCRFES